MDLLPNAGPAVFTADAEGAQVVNVKYLPGDPRQIRFDAKAGKFNAYGTEPLGTTLTFQPLAWEFFDGNILNMGQKSWVEIFYLDEKNRLCAVLFHGNSVNALRQVRVPLFYDNLTLADVILTAVPEKKEYTKSLPKGTYYIANFSYEMADPKRTADLAQLTTLVNVYREESINQTRVVSSTQGYTVPETVMNRILVGNSNSLALPAGVE